MKIFLLFYMCDFAVGLTHCYKTTVFLHLFTNDSCSQIALYRCKAIESAEKGIVPPYRQRRLKRFCGSDCWRTAHWLDPEFPELSAETGKTLKLFTSDKGGGRCFARACLSVCLLARLLKNACTDLDEMLCVDTCRDVDELVNFWARSGL